MIGIPHPVLGEEVAAAIVLIPGASVDEADIVEFVKARWRRTSTRASSGSSTSSEGRDGKILKREIRLPGTWSPRRRDGHAERPGPA